MNFMLPFQHLKSLSIILYIQQYALREEFIRLVLVRCHGSRNAHKAQDHLALAMPSNISYAPLDFLISVRSGTYQQALNWKNTMYLLSVNDNEHETTKSQASFQDIVSYATPWLQKKIWASGSLHLTTYILQTQSQHKRDRLQHNALSQIFDGIVPQLSSPKYPRQEFITWINITTQYQTKIKIQ